MDAIVHIGLPKTGTTTIQNWLAANRRVLAAQDVHYDLLDTGGGLAQPFGLVTGAFSRVGQLIPYAFFRESFGLTDLDTQIGKSDDFSTRFDASLTGKSGTILLSSEYLAAWLDTPALIGSLDVWLGARFATVRYVVYLRRQEDWVRSKFIEAQLQNPSLDLELHITAFKDTDYHRHCCLWRDTTAKDRLDVRLLEPDWLTGGDLIADFRKACNMPDVRTTQVHNENEALSAKGMRLARLIHRLGRGRLTVERAVQLARRVMRIVGSGRALRFTDDQINRIRAANRDSNERLRREFFPDLQEVFP